MEIYTPTHRSKNWRDVYWEHKLMFGGAAYSAVAGMLFGVAIVLGLGV